MSVAIAAEDSYLFPQVTSLDAQGHNIYIDDAALIAAIPELASAGERSRTCANSAMTPPYLFVSFGPVATGAQVGSLTNLRCKFDSKESKFDGTGNLTCDPPQARLVEFGEDLNHSLLRDEKVDVAEARELSDGSLPMANPQLKPDLTKLREITIG